MARRWRAWHPEGGAPGAEVRLQAEEAHHVVRVLRLREGEPLAVFDGAGREWEGTVLASGRAGVVVRLGEERRDQVEPALAVSLVQGLCRPERIEWALEKVTEVGVRSVVLAGCARSEVPAPTPTRLTRWRRILVEASKQSGRRWVPDLLGPLPLAEAAALAPAGERIVLHPGAPPLGVLLRAPSPSTAALAVGPEGGFAEREVEMLGGAGWRAASLGPRVLRAESAGPIAVALLLHSWGDFGA